MERRYFIKKCTALCTAGIGFSILTPGCGSIHYAVYSDEADRIKITKAEFIDAKKRERKFVVVRTERLPFPICLYPKGQEYVALYMQCTHQGCELQPNNVSLVCPCHGSEFSNEGKVQSPPADKDLRQFKTSTDNENIYIVL